MSNEIQKSSIKEILNSGYGITNNKKVRSILFDEEMTLLGFIPFTNTYLFLDETVNLNDRLIVNPFYVKFPEGSVYPLFTTIWSAENRNYIVDNNLILDFLLEESLDLDNGKIKKHYTRPLRGDSILRLMHNSKNANIFPLERNEDGTYSYIGRKGELELSGFISMNNNKNNICITREILCVCAFINKVTGLPSYSVLSPEDTICIMTDDE